MGTRVCSRPGERIGPFGKYSLAREEMNIRLLLVLLVALSWPLRAAEPAKAADAEIAAINAQIASPSEEQRQSAITGMREILKQQPPRASAALRSTWGKLLMEAREYEAVEELCLAAILTAPAETSSVETLMQLRIRCAIAQGKPEVALGHAKSLYNVSSMATTHSAMLLVAEALSAASPDDASRLNQFKQEQLAGAKQLADPTPAVYGQRPAYGSKVLASLLVDSAPYVEKLRSSYAEDYWSLQGRGNLMLMADRPAEARELFERAYSVAQENQLNYASENLARCIKAEDGVIGRANSWAVAIRPKAPAR